jgi:hypothetical protein
MCNDTIIGYDIYGPVAIRFKQSSHFQNPTVFPQERGLIYPMIRRLDGLQPQGRHYMDISCSCLKLNCVSSFVHSVALKNTEVMFVKNVIVTLCSKSLLICSDNEASTLKQ